ncbi:MAG: AbrB/MazE/SpoVT family DNA-binding domain-containing protein [Gemmatimonadetes bacterium]|nr:AbrB/MazE/SpoVT family DNA-binding domain-containing protein [Gemmatimonadota bacterium]
MPANNVVTVSPKYQVVIPRSIRESLGLRPGQKVQALQYQDRVELVPFRPVKSMRGFLKEESERGGGGSMTGSAV